MTDSDKKSNDISVELERLMRDVRISTHEAGREPELVEYVKYTGRIGSLAEKHPVSELTIDMMVEHGEDEKQVAGFFQRLDEIIHEISDQYGGILSESFLFNGIMQVTIMLERRKVSELMVRMAFLPQVERIMRACVTKVISSRSMMWQTSHHAELELEQAINPELC